MHNTTLSLHRDRNVFLTTRVPYGRYVAIRCSPLRFQSEIEIDVIYYVNINSLFSTFYVQITWTDGTGAPIGDVVKTNYEVMAADNRRITTRSVLKFVPKMEHHNTSIWCQAHNSAIDKKLQTKIHLHVKFAPKVSALADSACIIYSYKPNHHTRLCIYL